MATPNAKAFSARYGTFIRAVQIGTGLNFRTVWTWVAAEGGPPDNPLNIGPGNRYGSPLRGAAATVSLLRSPQGRKYGYSSILATAGQPTSNQLKAIALSAWNGGPLADASVKMEYAALLERTHNYWFPTGKIRIGLQDVTVKNPATQIDDAAGLLGGGIGSLVGNILSANFWARVIMVIVGLVFGIGALVFFSRELGKGAIA